MFHLLLDADVYAPESLGKRNILVAGDKIVWMGDRVPRLDSALSVDTHHLAGLSVVPGLIDGHVLVIG